MDFAHPVQSVIPGVQGRMLAVLAETSAELSLRTIARLSGVSIAQASRVLPTLVELGLVERRDVPPSALFHFVEEHVASQAVLALARSRQIVLDVLGQTTAAISPPPISVIIFGSFARGDSRPDSDIDVVVVRPSHISEDDTDWVTSLEQWRRRGQRLAGNRIEIMEVDSNEIARLLRSRKPVWLDIAHDGIVITGHQLGELKERRSA